MKASRGPLGPDCLKVFTSPHRADDELRTDHPATRNGGVISMPPELATKINQDINESLTRPEISARLQKLTLEPMLGTPTDAAKFFAEETAPWGRVIKEKNVTVQ